MPLKRLSRRLQRGDLQHRRLIVLMNEQDPMTTYPSGILSPGIILVLIRSGTRPEFRGWTWNGRVRGAICFEFYIAEIPGDPP
ncbi:MAG: hypothetical protein COB10_10060 [Planctomycetota bacterium]|nr:MAG: hypothetical protein COB10_10060 [Planctomycetota bacterium]